MKILIPLILCLSNYANSQTSIPKTHQLKDLQKNKIDSVEDAIEKINQFRFQAGYANKVIFAGRNFGVNQAGATFGTSYHHHSGITLEYEGNYWTGMSNRYALTEFGAYFEKTVSETFYLTAGYWRLLYQNGDEEERKTFTNYFLIDESWFTPAGQLNASYLFIKGIEDAHRVDVNLSRAINLYNFLLADKFTVEPTFTITFATVNYLTFLSSLSEVSNENQNAFKIGNYEFMLPLAYKKLGKYELNIAWHRAWPVAIREEKVKAVSYVTLEFVKRLLIKKSNK